MARKKVIIVLEYDDDSLTPDGISRCEPSNVEELIEEVERNNNASEAVWISLKLLYKIQD